jgi:hypothetical protein
MLEPAISRSFQSLLSDYKHASGGHPLGGLKLTHNREKAVSEALQTLQFRDV